MKNTLELDIRKYETTQQTQNSWQDCQRGAKETQQVENEAFAAQIEAHEAWQAAIWLD